MAHTAAHALRALRQARGLSLRQLADAVPCSYTTIWEIEAGRKPGSPEMLARIDDALNAGGAVAASTAVDPAEYAAEADDLAARVAASDVSRDTLDTLTAVVDDLATAYATTPPEYLVPRVRQHLAYVARLIEVRKTLAQQRRLLVIGGWLSLLGATLHIDQRHPGAATARLTTAQQLAAHADHPEIAAWCWETRAWEVLTAGNYPRAVELSQRAQAIAPAGSSALIQATAQEGRAWARMGRWEETRAALDRVERMVAPLPRPERPEHHYQYDPDKARSYTATTLAWAGDPAAEQVARAVVVELDRATRPRRAASARLDLALALVAAGKPDEACAFAAEAVRSGRVVASNWWRVDEVLSGVDRAGIGEAADLRELCAAYAPGE